MCSILSLLNDPNFYHMIDSGYGFSQEQYMEIYSSPLDIFEQIINHNRFYNFVNYSYFYIDSCYEGDDKAQKIILLSKHANITCFPTFMTYLSNLINPTSYRAIIILIKSHSNRNIADHLFRFNYVRDNIDNNIDDDITNKIINAFLSLNVDDFVHLLENGYNISGKNNEDNTIIHQLCLWGIITFDIFKLFSTHPNFDPNINSNLREHKTILHILSLDTTIDEDLKCELVIKLLDHPLIKLDSFSILSNVCRNDNIKLVKLLLTDDRIIHIGNIDANSDNFVDPIFDSCNLDLLTLFLNQPNIPFEIISTMINLSINSLADNRVKSLPFVNGKSISIEKLKNFVNFILNYPTEKSNDIYNSLLLLALEFDLEDFLIDILSHKNFSIDFSNYSPISTGTNIYQLLKILKQDERFQTPNTIRFENGDTLYHVVFDENLEGTEDDPWNPEEISKYREINRYFIEDWKMDPLAPNKINQTILHFVCRNGLYEIFMDIYERLYPNIDLNISDDCGKTLLHYMSVNMSVNMSHKMNDSKKQLLKFLATHPSIDHTKIDRNGRNIFHFFCEVPSHDILQFLIEDVQIPITMINARTKNGSTSFNVLATSHYYRNIKELLKCVKYLINIKGIDCLTQNNQKYTPLHNVCIRKDSIKKENMNDYIELIKYMVENIDGIVLPNRRRNIFDPIIENIFDNHKNKYL